MAPIFSAFTDTEIVSFAKRARVQVETTCAAHERFVGVVVVVVETGAVVDVVGIVVVDVDVVVVEVVVVEEAEERDANTLAPRATVIITTPVICHLRIDPG
jgi:hypothetical protein